MKGKQQDILSIIKNKETSLCLILVYGPNIFLVNELYSKLKNSLIDKDKDIFGSKEFTAKEITTAPENFYTETQSIMFSQEKSYIRINMSGSEAGGAILDFLKGENSDVCLIVRAGALSPRSSLRRATENSDSALIVPCYDDDNASLISFISEKVHERKFIIRREASQEILYLTGLERGRVNDSVDRLMLYLDSSENREIMTEDVKSVVFDTNQSQINDLCSSMCLGEIKKSQQALSRLFLQGITPPQFISFFLSHFQKIHFVGLRILSGIPARAAIKELKPPVFFKEIGPFQNQVELWGVKKTERALEILIETDLKTKTLSVLGQSIVGDVVVRLANVARK